MKSRLWPAAIAVIYGLMMPLSWAQSVPGERTFPQSKPEVEAALRHLQSSTSGRLPALDGFAVPGEQPLDSFQKGYYQCTIQVSSTPAGGTLVRVSAKITAWYNAPVAAKSGYQVLPSNGRLEADLLDRLADALAKTPSPTSAAPPTAKNKGSAPSSISAAGPELPSAPSFKGNAFPRTEHNSAPPPRSVTADRHSEDLAKEAKNLEEILRNQSYPNNLAAVRKSGTPVLMSPSEGAKLMFLAEAEDEFEILETNESWVHVRISGLSRAWIRRSSLELPESSESEDALPQAPAPPAAANKPPFRIESEQTASFPSDWEPLRGKTVRIVSIQKAPDSTADTGSPAKLAFAKELFAKEYDDLTQSLSTASGLVLVFDSADGGMMAVTVPVLREWKAGTLSDEALWRRCYFDPPEMLHGAGQ